MRPDGNRFVPGSPPGGGAARAPLIDVTPPDSTSGVQCVTVAVVWDPESATERDYVRIYRDGTLAHDRSRISFPAQAVGRDEDAQPEGSYFARFLREGGHHWPGRWQRVVHEAIRQAEQSEQDGGERSDPAA